jgi:hypothetical protein
MRSRNRLFNIVSCCRVIFVFFIIWAILRSRFEFDARMKSICWDLSFFFFDVLSYFRDLLLFFCVVLSRFWDIFFSFFEAWSNFRDRSLWFFEVFDVFSTRDLSRFFFRASDVFSTRDLSCFFFRAFDVFSTRDLSRFFFKDFDVFSTRDLSRFFLRDCDVWSKWESKRRNTKEMRACLMIVLDRVSIEWVFERQQETVFCLLEETIDSHDSIFLFEQTVVSLAVRFKSFWVRTRKEEKDKLIIDKNVFRDSTWVRISIHKKCIRWYASSLQCFHARVQSSLH